VVIKLVSEVERVQLKKSLFELDMAVEGGRVEMTRKGLDCAKKTSCVI
jgi:hypothetical protein